MQLISATTRYMPDEYALVVVLATVGEVRTLTHGTGDVEIPQAAYDELIATITDVDNDE